MRNHNKLYLRWSVFFSLSLSVSFVPSFVKKKNEVQKVAQSTDWFPLTTSTASTTSTTSTTNTTNSPAPKRDELGFSCRQLKSWLKRVIVSYLRSNFKKTKKKNYFKESETIAFVWGGHTNQDQDGTLRKIHPISLLKNMNNRMLVGGFQHFLFSIIYGIILPIDFHIFQDGWNHQPGMTLIYPPESSYLFPQ